MFLMAVAGMFAFAACNNNAKPEVEDSMTAPAEEVAAPVQDVVDTMAQAVEGAVDAAAETVVNQ